MYRKEDIFNDRHGRNNPHEHNDNFYFDKEMCDEEKNERFIKFGKHKSCVSKKEEFIIVDEDNKVLSLDNEHVFEYLEGSKENAVIFDNKQSIKSALRIEREAFPEKHFKAVEFDKFFK